MAFRRLSFLHPPVRSFSRDQRGGGTGLHRRVGGRGVKKLPIMRPPKSLNGKTHRFWNNIFFVGGEGYRFPKLFFRRYILYRLLKLCVYVVRIYQIICFHKNISHSIFKILGGCGTMVVSLAHPSGISRVDLCILKFIIFKNKMYT